MNPELLIALLKAQMNDIAAQRDLEKAARDALSGRLTGELSLLFPSVSPEFIDANGNFSNELQRGADEIIDAVTGAAPNWTGTEEDSGVEDLFTPDLLNLMATDALVSGKLCLYPRVNAEGQFVVEAPAGYLHPIFDEDDDLKVEEVLQVVYRPRAQKYRVTRFSRGLIQVYPLVTDWLKFADNAPEESWEQTHAPDRLPIAFSVIRRDANRQPLGLVAAALPAFRRYMKTAINRNAVQEIAGFPERVVKSDKYLRLYLGMGLDGMKNNLPAGQEHPAITALKDVGAYNVKILGQNDVYEVVTAADPKPHLDAEQTDKQALLDTLKSPDLGGGTGSGVALEVRQTKARNAITALCNQIAAMITDACALADAMGAAGFSEGIKASLTPQFPVDKANRATQAGDLFSKGALKKSHLWTELQSAGWNSISDDDIDDAKAQEDGTFVPRSLRTDTPSTPTPTPRAPADAAAPTDEGSITA